MSKSPTERVKASQAQIDFLMCYMRDNICLSRPLKEKLLTAQETAEKWECLAVSLNGIEGAKKSMQQWQKTWRDIQNSMRKRGIANELNTSTVEENTMDFDEQIEDLNLFVLEDSTSTETQDASDKTIDVKPTYRAKVNNRQLEHLFRHMNRNSEMYEGTASKGLLVRAQLESRWVRLTQALNNLGPPCKTVLKWKQTWRDIRSRLKKKKTKKIKSLEQNDNFEETDKKSKKPRGKLNERQLSHIINHMKRHGGDLLKAVSRPGDGSWRNRMRLEAHWTRLTQALNDLGPPCKPANKWRQTWRDLRRKIEMKDRINDISIEELDSNYIEENANDSIEEDSKPDISEERFYKETTEENKEEDFEFNPVFVDANPIIDETNEEFSQHNSKTESMQCLIDFEKESLDLRKRQIALEEKRIQLKEKKLITEEAKVQALQRIAAALEERNLGKYNNRFNLT